MTRKDKPIKYYDDLYEFAETPRQQEFIEALLKAQTIRGASEILGINPRNGDLMMKRIRKNAANRHYAPENNINNPLPLNMKTRGVSQLLDEDGKVKMTWYKSASRTDEAVDRLIDALESYNPKPLPVIKRKNKKLDKDCLDLLTLTDYHFGLQCWGKETGDDWDLDRSMQIFMQTVYEMVQKAKVSNNSETAILNLQGDLLHYDNVIGTTPQSGHIVDREAGVAAMVEGTMHCCHWAIELLLQNYKHVHVFICEGNHDLFGSIWLRKHLKKLFSKNKRVTIDDTEIPFYAYLHGKTMLAFHHGHRKKNEHLPGLFMGMPVYRKMWGEASYTYIHTGHYHHREKMRTEADGCVVERHPTIAAADKYAVTHGYVSKRGAYVITYHSEDGEIDRSSVYP